MSTLYVTEPGTQVHKADERLLVMRGEEVVNDIPIIKINRIVMVGRGVSMTTPTLHALSRQGIDVLYLSGAGRFISRVIGPEHNNVRLRYAQSLFVSDPKRSLDTARKIVTGKLNNQRIFARRNGLDSPSLSQSIGAIDAMLQRVGEPRSSDELRGLEGQAARAYFQIYRGMLRPPADAPDWGFNQRSYYPPPDPINALLSFGYTLLLNDLIVACQMIGLDPHLGVFHAIDYGRPSMALDLEEEFRPVIVDSLVLGLVNRRVIGIRDFVTVKAESEANDRAANSERKRPGGIILNQNARNRFLKAYENRVLEEVHYPPIQGRTPYRHIFELQAEQMARVILEKQPEYTPFLIR